MKLNVKGKNMKTMCGQNGDCYKFNLVYVYQWALKADTYGNCSN